MNEKQTFLLVDDSIDDLVMMREGFAQANCTHPLQEVHNGEEAISYLKGEGPWSDRSEHPLPIIMLLDLNMPKKNGYDVLVWVRSQPGLKHLTIIILSASMRNEDVERTYYLGASGFLVKPSTLEKLVTMMRSLCAWIEINHFPPLRELAEESKL